MTTLVPGSHPLLAYGKTERLDYLTIVAAMTLADGVIDDVEKKRLQSLCESFELGEDVESVIATARAEAGESADSLEPRFDRLQGSELRYALLVDLIDLAVGSDGDIGSEEKEVLDAFADALSITNGQLALTTRFVLERRTNSNAEPDPDTIAGLAAVGVPVAALAVMAPLGAPIAAGLGLAAALGVGSFVSVKWLVGKLRRSKKSGEGEAEADSDSDSGETAN